MLDYHAENTRVRRDQQRGFMDVLHLVDVAGIPFPDEPPIIYPSAARWKQITEDRKRYKSVDLAKPGSAEQKIYDALDGTVQNLNFTETPLRDVIAQLKDSQGIPIQLDMKALEDAGIDLDTPVTKDLSGISLRSSLRLLLGDIDLTYLIKDEVLLITTKEKAGENLVIKVYPVADLVLPVNPQGGINPFQMGGGLGGASGMGGGMGGMGMGGMGGGMMGGGMGMGGMAFTTRAGSCSAPGSPPKVHCGCGICMPLTARPSPTGSTTGRSPRRPCGPQWTSWSSRGLRLRPAVTSRCRMLGSGSPAQRSPTPCRRPPLRPRRRRPPRPRARDCPPPSSMPPTCGRRSATISASPPQATPAASGNGGSRSCGRRPRPLGRPAISPVLPT
jgi:hypothetical protein